VTQRLRIAVIGAGTAGAAAAVFLSRAGHDVTVFERVREPGPVGAGIMMQPSGLVVLERLGLAGRVIERGSRVARLVCETRRTGREGRPILDLHYAMLADGLFGVGLHRGVLFETLHGALVASSVRLRCGVAVARLRPARSTRSDRVEVVDDAGRGLGVFDLAAVCDGARSRVRDAMPALSKRVRPYPWGALWYIGHDREGAHAGQLRQLVRGARQMVGLLPTGLGPGRGAIPLVSLFVSTRADTVAAVRARRFDAWKDEVRSIAPMSASLLEQIHDFEQLTFASYYDVILPRWHAHRTAFLGDAAHATSPQLGQGYNLALCGAAALADAVEGEPTVEAALARYSISRRAHLAYYQLATRWLTPFFQSDHDWLGALRDAVMGPACALGFVRREMVRSMAGTKTGILWGSLETRMPRG
jgi:2-polyprenyl-6-methoxyphenol hydroxylase-like FAD-dependent oxidoreductase